MPFVILYIRVSTGEQPNKGYSLLYQEDILRQYCFLHATTVLRTYKEDHSAKSIDRPSWTKLISELKSSKRTRPQTSYSLLNGTGSAEIQETPTL